MNLYNGPKPSNQNSVRSSQKLNGRKIFLSFGIFSLICLVGLYFSSFPWPMQIIMALIMISTCYGFVGVYRLQPCCFIR